LPELAPKHLGTPCSLAQGARGNAMLAWTGEQARDDAIERLDLD
jgi:DNA-binding IclR family transcriptional regulator